MKPRIKQRNSQFQSSLAGVCSVLLMLSAGQPGFAQQSAFAKPAAAAAATTPTATLPALKAATDEKETSAPSKPGSEGVQVHGHWKFVVHDTDGRLVSTREFENSLLTPLQGDEVLSMLLQGSAVGGDWAIVLCPSAVGAWAGNNYGFVVCTAANPVPDAVLLTSLSGSIASALFTVEPQVCPTAPCVAGLVRQVNVSGSAPVSFSLSGSYTATANLTINAVETLTAPCTSNTGSPSSLLTVTPQACAAAALGNPVGGNAVVNFYGFTGTRLGTTGTPPAQSLTPGQVLTVTVTISFS
jgi:hypothetical protein